jgi:hypothetical protein
MTKYFVGCNNVQGVVDSGVTIATSTQTKAIEVNIDGAQVTDKATALLLLEKLEYAIAAGTWPLV